MKLAALALLAVLIAACGGEKKAPPAPPTAEALGAELATFPQLLVPISTTTWASMRAAASRGNDAGIEASRYPNPYDHGKVQVAGRETPILVAFTSVMMAPAGVPLQPMSVQQYLRAFMADAGTDLGGVVAQKGNIYFTRAQLPDIIIAVSKTGVTLDDMPYSMVRGAGR